MNLDKERKMCEDFEKKKGYCYWGICKFCGVPSFTKKLENGEVNHSEEKLKKFKKIVEERDKNKDWD